MRRVSVGYWDAQAASSDEDTRDAILAGFRTARAFDEAGAIDAAHLVLPFVAERDVMLEIGCGIGRLLKWSAPHCRRTIGVDVSKEMLHRAKAHLAGTGVELYRLKTDLVLPFAPRSIDFVLFYHVSEHLEREDTWKLLREIRRVLRPTGRALVAMALLDHPDNQHEFTKWARHGDPDDVRSRFYSESEATTLLQMAGLHPQLRLYVPGEFVAVVTPKGQTTLGAMPLVGLSPRRGGTSDRDPTD